MTLRFAHCRKGIRQRSVVGTVIVTAMASLVVVAMVVAMKLVMAKAKVLALVQAP